VFAGANKVIAGLLGFARTVLVDTLVVAAIILIALIVHREIWRPDTVIDEIGLPENLSKLGYSGRVAAMRLVDAVNQLNDEAQRFSDLNEKTSLVPTSRHFELVEPQTGVSLRTISAAVDLLFPNRRTHVAGEFICTDSACTIPNMQLRLRVFRGNVLDIATAGPIGPVDDEGDIESYFRKSAVELLKAIDPIVIAERLAASAAVVPYDPEFGDQKAVWNEAIRIGKALVRRGHEDDARAAALLGQMYSMSGEPREAERWFVRVDSLASPAERAIVGTARYHWGVMLADTPEAREKLNQAADLFQAAEADGGLHSSFLVWQGLTLEELERYPEAEAVYEKLTREEPENSGAMFQLAMLIASRAQSDNDPELMRDAIGKFEVVLDIDSTHYAAHNEIGHLLMALGEPVAAVRRYAHAVSLAPGDKILQANLSGARDAAMQSDREATCALLSPDAEEGSAEPDKLADLLGDTCGSQ
jgi:tetratricopeptide (TPR) repeat protein